MPAFSHAFDVAPRLLTLVLLGLSLTAGQAVSAATTPVSVPISNAGSTSPVSAPYATDANGQNEIDLALNGDADGSGSDNGFSGVNRTIIGASTGHGRVVKSGARAKSNPALGVHFDGLNFHDQRFANGGNQFSVEPPDQGMCAGNGYVVEAVNDVMQVYNGSGNALLNGAQAVDLNTFLGYAPAIVRSGPNAGQRGPSVTDPSCLYDPAIGRFVLVALVLDHVGVTANLNGNDHVDIAVSDTANPTGTWTIYRLPVQNNGTQGTPDHQCNSGSCLGDYPHIGADANGIYLTTNEFAFVGPGFYGAQVYAIGNNLLTGQPGSAVLFDTLGAGPDGAGFTVWPAQGTQFDGAHGGTEYFLSSDAVFQDSGSSTSVLLWSLTGTASLNSATPGTALNVQVIAVDQYAVPPLATQPAGSRPLSQCIADLTLPCNLVVAGINTHDNTTFGNANGGLNSNDSRMGQVFYANGKVWGALGTAVTVGGNTRAGAAYYVVNPHSGKLDLQGQAGFADADMTYPEVGVLPNGRGVLAFTLTGDNDYPSAAYASLDAKIGLGPVALAAAGAGPWDGFTSYVQFGAGRPRWGDYGATAVDGNSIWIASEYIAQTCSYSDYLVIPRGQCGGTRGALSNWATHVSKLTP